MQDSLYKELKINTFLLQFYGFLTRGFFSVEVRQRFGDLTDLNIEFLNLISDQEKWNSSRNLLEAQLNETKGYVEKAKSNLGHPQICDSEDIAGFLLKNKNFFQEGISLNDLKCILDISSFFRNGYMLHDSFLGYPENNLFSFSISSSDYLHSAAHFYNEAYDYYNNKKEVKLFEAKDFYKMGPFDFRRIQPREEVIYRNFREAYINLIFFFESFINSVGFDAYLAGAAKNQSEELQLKGIKGNSYLGLIGKLQSFSKIISGNKIDIESEPFKLYLMREVELRNQYIHLSPNKPKISLSYEDWKRRCDELITTTGFSFIEAFWKKCYPTKVFPKVIFNTYWSSFKGIQGRAMVME